MSVTDQTNSTDQVGVNEQLAAMRAEFGSYQREMAQELARTRAEVTSLQQRLDDQSKKRPSQGGGDRVQNESADVPTVLETSTSSSRRDLLKKGGVGAAAAVAGLAAMSKPAAADDGDAILAGAFNQSQSETVLDSTATTGGNIFTASDGGGGSFYPAALGGYGYGGTVDNGVYAYSNSRDDANTNTGHAIVAWGDNDSRSHMWMVADKADPRTDAYAHGTGEFRHPNTGGGGDLWFCVADGTPGTWRKLAGPDTAGAFHPISPKRVWDTRFQGGPMTAGEQRTISVADGRAVGSSAVDVVDLVPDGATAITFNVTIVSVTATGWLAVTPGGTTTVDASTINWTSASSVLANGSLSQLDTNRQVTMICSESGSSHFILDVTGYYL